MHIGFFKNIENYLKQTGNKKILVLNVSYFSYNPTNQNVKISKYLETFKKFDFKFEEEKTKSIRQSSTINKNFVRECGLLFKNNNKNI
ncbi:MAG: hypothetical protein ACJ0RJ_02905 [Alphaproteobacteria bacterium]